MLSILFAIEPCYKIKENNNKEKIILPRPVTILPMSIAILLAKIEKSLFCISTFLPRPKNLHWQYQHNFDNNWTKNILFICFITLILLRMTLW